MRVHFAAIAFIVGLSACGAPQSPTTSATKYSSMTTSQLWSRHLLTSSPLELAFVEAELGARGQTSFGTRYLGQETASAYGRSLYSRNTSGAVTGDKNCSDFSGAAAAQKFYLAAGGPVSDPHNLDRDGDGFACEWGATVSNIHKAKSYRPAASTRRSSGYSSSRCYTGPRGGTYTITASGNKNYGGC